MGGFYSPCGKRPHFNFLLKCFQVACETGNSNVLAALCVQCVCERVRVPETGTSGTNLQ